MEASGKSPEPEWMVIARGELGVHEIPGVESEARILEYLRTTRLPKALIKDETAWCSGFVNWCIKGAGLKGTDSAAARSWLTYGQEEPIQAPRIGAIAVLTRPGAPGSGHVGFFAGKLGADLALLGGNQNNSVCIKLYSPSRLLGYRWPVVG